MKASTTTTKRTFFTTFLVLIQLLIAFLYVHIRQTYLLITRDLLGQFVSVFPFWEKSMLMIPGWLHIAFLVALPLVLTYIALRKNRSRCLLVCITCFVVVDIWYLAFSWVLCHRTIESFLLE